MTNRHSNHGLRKICACPRRTWAKCAHSWHYSLKWGAAHHRFSIDKHAGTHIDRKADAEDLARTITSAIKAGTFGQPAPVSEMTVRQLATVYQERFVAVAHPASAAECRSRLNVICRTPLPHPTGGMMPFGDWRLSDCVTDTVERYRETRRAAGTGLAGTNRSLARLRAMYNWGLRTGYVEQTPFKRHGEAVVKLSRELPRSRRLDADRDEEARLLAACGPHLRACVEGALETGMRHGELMSLQWRQVEGMKIDQTTIAWAPRAEIFLPAGKTKTKRDRRIPISTRLKSILEMRALDPNGQPHPAEHYVFGNAIGQKVLSIKRAWMTAVLKANGVPATYDGSANLVPASRAALAQINLHFHDLRREAGSRWMDGGLPLGTIQRWLGHKNISQTSTYLSGTPASDHDALRQYEDRLTSLQQLATEVETGGRKSPPAAERHEETPNETAGGRQMTIM